MKRNRVGSYRDAGGVRHRLVVRPAGDRAWEVVDVDPTDVRLVERLTDGVDGRPQAEAIARDYLTTAPARAVSRDPGAAIQYLSEEEPVRATIVAQAGEHAIDRRERPRCRVRLADGRVFSGPLAPERHRALQLGILHERSDGLIELAAGARRDGRLQITTRRRSDHFLPGGANGGEWVTTLLGLAACHADRGEEVFVAPAVRHAARGDKHAVDHTRVLWVDVDEPGQLPRLWALLAERPCHLLVAQRRQRRRPRLLEARRTAAGDAGGGGDRGAGGADRARPPAADPPPRSRSPTGARTSRTRRARSARG